MYEPYPTLPCPATVVCRCLHVTDSEVRVALTMLDAKSVADIRHLTGAGDGCTACHRVLKCYLDEHQQTCSSAEPICSGR